VIVDSITGLLLYQNLQRVVQFIRSALVKVEEKDASCVFTLVKRAHDLQTEMSLYAMFPTVIELLKEDNKETRRFVRVVKAIEYVEPSFREFKIVKDNIILPDHIVEYIMKVLKSQ
jgi:DNA topoisomerase VI subunit B